MSASLWHKSVFGLAAVGCIAVAYLSGQAAPQAPAAQGPAVPSARVGGAPPPAAQGAGRGAGRGTQWGRGPIRVAIVTKGHNFGPRDEFFGMFDAMAADISWTSVEHPAADVLLQPKYSDLFDVYVFYDIGGAGMSTQARGGGPAPVIPPGAFLTSNNRAYPQPSAEFKAEFPKLLKQGDKGFVFFHHSNASWVHVWPEYTEVVGSACDWSSPLTVRGIEHPRSGYFQNTTQKIAIVDKAHPITRDLQDFEIVDESYNCVFFEDSVHPLARTDFRPADVAANLNPRVPFSNLAAYVKTAENSPVAYVQMGHDVQAWTNPSYRQLMLNAIKWAASPEAKAWAKANRKPIFK